MCGWRESQKKKTPLGERDSLNHHTYLGAFCLARESEERGTLFGTEVSTSLMHPFPTTLRKLANVDNSALHSTHIFCSYV